MNLQIRLALLSSLILIAVIATGTPANSSYAYGLMQASCAPWDGPAIAITLTTEPAECKRAVSGPFLSMGVWRGLPIHAGQVVKFGAGSDAGFASRCVKEGDCERAESGEITFDTYKEGTGATGHYTLHFKKGETIEGHFEAKWCDMRIVCG